MVCQTYGGTCVACVRHALRKAHLLVGVDDAHRRRPALLLPGDKGAEVASELLRMLLAGDDYVHVRHRGRELGRLDQLRVLQILVDLGAPSILHMYMWGHW